MTALFKKNHLRGFTMDLSRFDTKKPKPDLKQTQRKVAMTEKAPTAEQDETPEQDEISEQVQTAEDEQKAAQAQRAASIGAQQVIINGIDINVPFQNWVWLFLKIAFASIPAVIIISIVSTFITWILHHAVK